MSQAQLVLGEPHSFMALAHVMGMCFRCTDDLVVTQEVLDLIALAVLVPQEPDGSYLAPQPPRRRPCCGGARHAPR